MIQEVKYEEKSDGTESIGNEDRWKVLRPDNEDDAASQIRVQKNDGRKRIEEVNWEKSDGIETIEKDDWWKEFGADDDDDSGRQREGEKKKKMQERESRKLSTVGLVME